MNVDDYYLSVSGYMEEKDISKKGERFWNLSSYDYRVLRIK